MMVAKEPQDESPRAMVSKKALIKPHVPRRGTSFLYIYHVYFREILGPEGEERQRVMGVQAAFCSI